MMVSRKDNRKHNQLRRISIIPDFIEHAEGAVLASAGKTKVLCTASIIDEIPHWIRNQGLKQGWVTAEFAMLPRSTHERRKRETIRPDGRSLEIRRLISRSLRMAVNLENLGSRTCIVDCDVLQADGGTRTLSITGGYLALALALRGLARGDDMIGNLIMTEVAAISVGRVQGATLLDLDYEEDRIAEIDANVVMDGNGNFIEVQVTAEKSSCSDVELEEILDCARNGISDLISIQREFLSNSL